MREIASIALFSLAVFGVANAVVVLKTRLVFQALFGKIPILRDLIKCPPCVSFWVGMVTSFFVFSPASSFCHHRWASTLVDGFLAVGAVWLLHLKAERLAADPAKPLEL